MVNDKLMVRKLPGFTEFNNHLQHREESLRGVPGVGIFEMGPKCWDHFVRHLIGLTHLVMMLVLFLAPRTCGKKGHLDHLPMAVVSLQRLAQFRGVVWPILSRILAVGKCRVHVTGRILYRIGFHYTWTYMICDLHDYVKLCQLRSASCCLKPQWNMVELVAVNLLLPGFCLCC